MAYIDNEIINKIRNSLNIVDVISEYVPLTAKGRNFFGVCPFHDDHSPSMSVSPDKQIFTCFSCGASGNVFKFVQDYENISFIDAVKKMSQKTNINLGLSIIENKKPIDKTEYIILNLVQKYFSNNLNTEKGKNAISYLTKRNIDNNLINKFGLGLALDEMNSLSKLLSNKGFDNNVLLDVGISYDENTLKDTFRNRIMFPIHDNNGQIVGYSGRIFNNETTAKYVNSKASNTFKKGEILYNYYLAKDETKKNKSIIVVEGFMDVIRLSTIGINNAVGLMGTALTKEQIMSLKQLRCKVILCLDSDSAGELATISAGDQLFKANIELDVIRLEDYKDPDEYITNKGKDAFLMNLENSQNYLDYKIKYFKNKTSPNDSEKTAESINQLIATISFVNDPILKNILIEKIIKEFKIDKEIINAKLNGKEKTLNKNELLVEDIKNKRKNKVDKSSEAIIYLMVNNSKYIRQFDKRLGYLPNNDYKNLLSNIRCFYNENNDINIADFLSYIYEDEALLKIMEEIIVEFEDSISETEFDDYLNIVSKEVYQIRINSLKKDMEYISDINKKVEIANKITELKKKITKLKKD